VPMPLASFKTIFGCDLRTLALFRVMLALVLLGDLVGRARDLTAHYTDAGVLPRTALIGDFGPPDASLHLISGSAFGQGILFVVAGLVAVALLFGYRTRLATIVSWVLLISLQARNTLVLQGGDYLLVLLLFWSMFLPLGARFSVDAARDRRVQDEPNAYFSMATLALLIQCMSVYFFSALLKSDPMWIREGTAVHYALQLDYLVTPFGAWLRQFPDLLKGLTYYVWYLELVGPFVMFCPVFHVPVRLLLQACFITMHIGFLLCLEIGFFPFVSITSLLAFTPGSVWDKLASWARTPERRGLKMYFDAPCEFCRKVCLMLRTFLLLPDVAVLPAQDTPDIYKDMQAHGSWVVVDYDGTRHVRWDAVALVFRRSPILWPVGQLLGMGALRKIGDSAYEAVARNRARLGEVSAKAIPYTSQNIHTSMAGNILLGAVLLLVRSLPAYARRMPEILEQITSTLRLGQHWNMFAPAPGWIDGWYTVSGITKSGKTVDVLRGRAGEPEWTRPTSISQTYPTDRWRKYLVVLPTDKSRAPYYAQYLCRNWRENMRSQEALARLEIYFNAEDTRLVQKPRKTTPVLLYAHECAAGPGPRKGP
jgi:predicted DCC family thiol-disulfide oxidoreductase YuxK